MGLTDAKTAFNALELSDETRKVVQGIMDAATARGGMTAEEREKLLHVLEIEEELADIEVSVAEGALKALENFGNEVDSALESAASDLEEAGK